jgi:hypothetical protein
LDAASVFNADHDAKERTKLQNDIEACRGKLAFRRRQGKRASSSGRSMGIRSFKYFRFFSIHYLNVSRGKSQRCDDERHQKPSPNFHFYSLSINDPYPESVQCLAPYPTQVENFWQWSEIFHNNSI